jgi:PncC family amidohydrolase
MGGDDRGEGLGDELYAEASHVLARLGAAGHTLAVAESLTGGLLAASLTDVPGASAVFRGGVCAYATDLKSALLDVPEDIVGAAGVVSGEVARAMARGARGRLAATYALGTTGVAGPDEQEGRRVGTVFVAVAGPDGDAAKALRLSGDRQAIRRRSCLEALRLLRRTLDPSGSTTDP